MKKLLTGNEAIARGAYEAGVLVAAYLGTPSTEILENLSQYDEVYSEWSTNEKVALEVGASASIAGARSLVAMIEPSDSQECKDFIKHGFEIFETYDTAVLFRVTTRVYHSKGVVELGEREEVGIKEYTKDLRKYIMVPAHAKAKSLLEFATKGYELLDRKRIVLIREMMSVMGKVIEFEERIDISIIGLKWLKENRKLK